MKDNLTQRFDADYFKKRFLADEKRLDGFGFKRLKDIALIGGGKRLPIGSVFSDNGIPYIRAEDVKGGFVECENSPKISHDLHKLLHRYQAKRDDVLLTIVGNSIGDVGIVRHDIKCNLTENCVRVVSKDILPEYLFAYLKSVFGQNTIERERVGTAQPKLAIERIREFKIPKASNIFQNRMRDFLEKSLQFKEQSKQLYSQSEALLLKSLGLENFSPSSKNTNIKSFKDSFATSGRLDAEYYQPKYEEMVDRILNQSHAKLSDLVTIQKSIEPGSDEYSEDEEGLPFLRVADYNKFGISKPQKNLKTSFVLENQSKLKALKPKAKTILFSKDGSVGEAFCLEQDGNFITSGAVLHLKVRDTQKILPDYLTLVLNSKLVKMQAERDAGGSIILHWRVGEIEEVLIPVIDFKTQSQISDLIQESFALKSKSEKLLELAKQAVEMAIEESEEKAIKFIEQQKNL